ncbi:MAG: hypothetical protein K1X35_05270 [Caulobacteraceae bacterium]|nr:hypothetical protein [Caulobacteraceae bacterium]
MRPILVSVVLAAASLTPAFAAAPSPAAPLPAPGPSQPDPRIGGYLFRTLCLEGGVSPQGMVDKARAKGVRDFVDAPLSDPENPAIRLDFHKRGAAQFDGQSFLFTVRHRVLTVSSGRPVHFTECMVDLPAGRQAAAVAADVGSMLGPANQEGAVWRWAWQFGPAGAKARDASMTGVSSAAIEAQDLSAGDWLARARVTGDENMTSAYLSLFSPLEAR